MAIIGSNSKSSNSIRKCLYDSKTSTILYIVIGLIFHVISIMSIFDIYFRSPVIEGLEAIPVPPNLMAPSKRVVFFIADGLRADTAFEKTEQPRMPFIHSKVMNDGIWGVSHTRVPTESRPGHVAMFAGIYEDPSSVMEGWKKNKVKYDHVLRQAQYSFSIGAPEIVDLFIGPNVDGQHYSAEDINFATNGEDLDTWSFKELSNLFSTSKDRWNNRTSAPTDTISKLSFKEKEIRLKSDGIMIMVHLLGPDNNGHAYLPSHEKYKSNASSIDQKIKKAVKEIEDYYSNDSKTTFIFTSDHGMSDSGTHGDGDPNCTRCPFVAWGSGISKPKSAMLSSAAAMVAKDVDFMNDSYSKNWSFPHLLRRDILQADICPTIATLLNIPIPSNSIGTLKSSIFSNDDISYQIRNLQQLLRNLETKESLVRDKEPPKWFRASPNPTILINELIENVKTTDDISKIYKLIEDSSLYYQRYDWSFLRISMTLAYIGWILLSFSSFIRTRKRGASSSSSSSIIRSILIIPFVIISFTIFNYLKEKKSPPQFYGYVGFALCFWLKGIENILFYLLEEGFSNIRISLSLIGDIFLYILGIQSFVVVFFWRELLGPLWIIGISLMTHILPIPALSKFNNTATTTIIIAPFLSTSIFPLLKPISKVMPNVYFIGWLGMLLGGSVGIVLFRCFNLIPSYLLLIASYLVCRDSDLKFTNSGGGGGLSSLNQMSSWFIVLGSIVSTLLLKRENGDSLIKRFFSILLTLSPMYVTFSIAFEPLFYLSLGVPFVILFYYIEEEESNSKNKKRNIIREYLFISWIFFLYLFVSFFGTGNFASISSFALPSVYRLQTVFEPFIMGSLLLAKIMIPVIVLSAAFGCWLRMLNIGGDSSSNEKRMFMIVIGSIDLMTLNFFFLVKDVGSWMEIGTSISHFVICSIFSVIVLLVYFLSNFFLSGCKSHNSTSSYSDDLGGDAVSDNSTCFNDLGGDAVSGGRILRSSSLKNNNLSKLPLPSRSILPKVQSNNYNNNNNKNNKNLNITNNRLPSTPASPRRETMLKPGNNSRY